ncbi:uncharacterized protein BDR25DRAFT_369117 [Lindgomyces ingoldianus]|uniref:Uncharacterized protein n=1 Tax=Lindgomyces ingoldianus TaxID=673940 RepID=A0ACB6QX80_9PLEO|nr:uncharacterized protein BDR25DRAFT_369117 [Lindgomyces ingoldianus]KAF2470677.1 hypothetical protein BDR25DRAFT_369117 [Lindgomyces ingoldianus]
MKIIIVLLITLSTFQNAIAHYVLSRFIANETIFPEWKYVRRVTPNTTTPLAEHTYPHYDISSPNIRCGRGAGTSGPGSEIATVVAGSVVGFRLDLWNAPYVMFHDGPLLAYMSKSPEQTRDGLKEYDGGGEWFKIAQRGPYNKTRWFAEYNKRFSEFNFTVPPTTPPGFYLLRGESIYPHDTFNRTQFYMNCASVEIVGGIESESEPGPLVRFPGAYDDYDEGIWVPGEVWNRTDLSRYKMPGPEIWGAGV